MQKQKWNTNSLLVSIWVICSHCGAQPKSTKEHIPNKLNTKYT